MSGRDMPFPPDLAAGTVGNKVEWRWLVRIDIASPVGTQRFTDYAPGAAPSTIALGVAGTVATNGTTAIVGTGTTFVADFVHGDQVYIAGETVRTVDTIADNTHMTLTAAASTTASGLTASLVWTETDVLIGGLDQGAQGPLSVSFVEFGNMDNTWGNWNESPGLRYAPVQVIHAQFNLDLTYAGPVKMYVGIIGGQQHGVRSHLQTLPAVNPYGRNGLFLTVQDFGTVGLMPERNVPVP